MIQENGSGNRKVAALAALMTACMLTACGGGGDASPTPPPPPPPPAVPADVQDAAAHAEMVATYTPAQHRVELTWNDRLTDETGYKVQRKSGSSWVDVVALGAQPGMGAVNWAGSLTEDSTLRVVATVRGFEVPLSLRFGGTELVVPAASPTIAISPAGDTLTNSVTMDVSRSDPNTPWMSVSFSLDGQTQYISTLDGIQFRLDTWGASNGPHQLTATVMREDLTIVVMRDVVIANSSVRIWPSFLDVVRPFPHSSSVELAVTTSVPDEAPAKVEAWIDDKPLGTIQTPNGCTWDANCASWGQQGTEFGKGSVYHFQFDNSVAGVGVHNFRVVATDRRGVTGENHWQVEVLNLPELTLSTPAEGAQVSGLLRIQGEAKTDRPTLDVSFSLIDMSTMVEKTLRTFNGVPGNSSFDFTYDLSGLPAGNYQLRMHAISGTGPYETQLIRSIIVK